MNSLLNFFSTPQVRQALMAISTQAVAFILFLWVMKLFFWKPVLRVLNERREKIKSKFDQCDEMEKQNLEFKRQYEKKLRSIDDMIDLRINEGIERGEKLSAQIIKNARFEAEKIVERGKDHLELELKKTREKLKDNLHFIIIKTSEKFLKSKIDQQKDREIISSIINDMDQKL